MKAGRLVRRPLVNQVREDGDWDQSASSESDEEQMGLSLL